MKLVKTFTVEELSNLLSWGSVKRNHAAFSQEEEDLYNSIRNMTHQEEAIPPADLARMLAEKTKASHSPAEPTEEALYHLPAEHYIKHMKGSDSK